METHPGPALDAGLIDRTARAVRTVSDRELVRLLASWRTAIGTDLVLTRWMLRPEERAAFDAAADAVRAASDARIRAVGRDADLDETAPERLAELALGHLVATTWSERLTSEQKRRLGAAWRVVLPKRTAA